MSKRRHRTRDHNSITNTLRFDSLDRLILSPLTTLNDLQDRRQWHPEGDNDYGKTFEGRAARVSARTNQKNARVKNRATAQGVSPSRAAQRLNESTVSFVLGRETTVCERRQQRREVMHATKKAGKGGQRPAKWNSLSKLRCK